MHYLSGKLSFEDWLECWYYMSMDEFSKVDNKQKNQIRQEYAEYMRDPAADY